MNALPAFLRAQALEELIEEVVERTARSTGQTDACCMETWRELAKDSILRLDRSVPLIALKVAEIQARKIN